MDTRPCTFLVNYERGDEGSINNLKNKLENGEPHEKIAALKEVILLLANGHRLPSLLMTIIRFIMPMKDKTLKKLLLLYWEVCEKTDQDGKLLHEMILVCSHFRNDLNHPNEYVRGITLRFISKLKEPELLEPLVPMIRTNLEHRQSYVRRNAVLAIYSIYKNFDHLLPDAPELIFNFLQNEGDASCKRNAFIMLFNCAQDKAVEYLGTVLDQVGSFGDILQFTIVELIRKVCRANPSERPKYLKCLFELLKSNSPAVQFEAAGALVSLTSAPTAVKAAASTYINILCNESDNNVKMIILDRLDDIRRRHNKELRTLLMDILRALASPDMDIRRKTLDIALDLVSPANIEEVISSLKREISKTQAQGFDKGPEYRQLLIQAIHQCAVRYPSVVSNVVHMLMDFLGDSSLSSAVEVITFVREVIETYPDLRESILQKLLSSFKLITTSTVYRAALWIIGEYSISTDDIDVSFSTIQEELGPLPFVEEKKEDDEDAEEKSGRESPRPSYGGSRAVAVLSDGTYATQSALTSSAPETKQVGGSLRALLDSGDFFLGSGLAVTLTKLVFRSLRDPSLDAQQKNSFAVDVLLILVGMVRLGYSTKPKTPIDEDSASRITTCIRVITEANSPKGDEEHSQHVQDIFIKSCHQSFSELLKEKLSDDEKEKRQIKVEASLHPDDLLKIAQLRPRKGFGMEELDDYDELSKATGLGAKADGLQLNRLVQLSGLSDPVFVEAFITVHQYDILLDVTVINQTPDTLTNLTLELATMGDLRLCERPRDYTVAPFDQAKIKANIKVSSTENGIIFGNIVYNIAGQASTYAADNNVVVLNEIHIDIMDYINPANCTNLEFRTMWSEFEWENKVAVNTQIKDVNEYLEHILRSTNMKCLTTRKALEGACGFLSANLYARSIFGEDALANLSIEQAESGKIEGFIRIRAKTQGIALSLGDKVTAEQRTNKKTETHFDLEEAQRQLGE